MKMKKYDYYIDSITEDKELIDLHQKIQDLCSSYYKINYNDEPVYFDKEQEKKDKHKMIDLLDKLNERLYGINDGGFVIDDRET